MPIDAIENLQICYKYIFAFHSPHVKGGEAPENAGVRNQDSGKAAIGFSLTPESCLSRQVARRAPGFGVTMAAGVPSTCTPQIWNLRSPIAAK
jgi:hypothetical protein